MIILYLVKYNVKKRTSYYCRFSYFTNFFSLLNIINSRVNNCGVNKKVDNINKTICQQFKNISRLDMDDIKLKVFKEL